MPEPKPHALLRFTHAALGLFASTTIQGAVCLTVGGALTYLGTLLFHPPIYQVPFLFFAGMTIPLWPLRVYFAPERVLERRFNRWDRWAKKGIITKNECKKWKATLRLWYENQSVRPIPPSRLSALPLNLENEDPD